MEMSLKPKGMRYCIFYTLLTAIIAKLCDTCQLQLCTNWLSEALVWRNQLIVPRMAGDNLVKHCRMVGEY